MRLPYDKEFVPPAPVLPVRIALPTGGGGVMVSMLVDTGADCTLVPATIANQLRLPQVGVIAVSGLGGATLRATVHAAVLDLGPIEMLVRVVALADEAILGRDVLASCVLELDGPSARIELRAPVKRRKKERRVRG